MALWTALVANSGVDIIPVDAAYDQLCDGAQISPQTWTTMELGGSSYCRGDGEKDGVSFLIKKKNIRLSLP